MNSSKKTTLTVLVVLAVIVIAGIIFFNHSSTASAPQLGIVTSSTTPVIVSETTKVSSTLSEYENAELGFSVKYPISWEREESNAGVTFIAPIDKTQVSTVATLESNIQVLSGTCAFPPVTTIQDHGTVQVGNDSLDMISMSNTVQGRSYFNRMYSLQHGQICYMFSFAAIALSPENSGLTGSNVTQAQNNNKAIFASADADFTNMVKSFTFIVTPAGKEESQVAPTK